MSIKSKFMSMSDKKRLAIIITAAVMVLVLVALSIYLIMGTVSRNQYIAQGLDYKTGSVINKNWSEGDVFDVDNYQSITVNGDSADILFLTDVHMNIDGWYTLTYWTNLGNQNRTFKQIDKVIDEADPDFIVVTGDTQADPMNDEIMQKFCNYLDSKKIPWIHLFGNHDAEWRADKAYLMNIIQNSEYGVKDAGPTNLQGLANTVVNFKNKDGKIFYSIICMDTGDWQQIDEKKINHNNVELNKSERRFSTKNVGITEIQTAWYAWVVNGLTKYNDGVPIETMVAAHIPLKAFDYAIEIGEFIVNNKPFAAEGSDYYETPEEFRNPKTKADYSAAFADYAENYHFYKTMKMLDSTKHMVTGHNHCAGYTVKYDGFYFTSVAKTGDNYTSLSWDNGKRGGTLITVSVNSDTDTKVTSNKIINY